MGDWASTPEELLEMVARLLRSNIADLVRFASVCRSWRSVVVRNHHSLSSDIPWLIFQSGPLDEMSYCLVSLIYTKRAYTLSLAGRINCDHLLVGAYKSWLLIACRDETLYLYNPFSCGVSLSHCGIVSPSWVSKFVLSANPGEGVDWVLMAIVNMNMPIRNKLMFYTSWDQAWTSLSTEIPLDDLVYNHHGQFLALYVSGNILVVSFEGHSHSTSEIEWKFESDNHTAFLFLTSNSGITFKMHLVSSSEQVLKVIQMVREEEKKTIAVMVFRLDWSTKKMIQIHHLDDSVLFVSKNYSGSRKALEVPGSRENGIYFIDYPNELFLGMGACFLQGMRSEFHGAVDEVVATCSRYPYAIRHHNVLCELAACCLQGIRIKRLVRRPVDAWKSVPNFAFWFTPSLS